MASISAVAPCGTVLAEGLSLLPGGVSALLAATVVVADFADAPDTLLAPDVLEGG